AILLLERAQVGAEVLRLRGGLLLRFGDRGDGGRVPVDAVMNGGERRGALLRCQRHLDLLARGTVKLSGELLVSGDVVAGRLILLGQRTDQAFALGDQVGFTDTEDSDRYCGGTSP